MSHTDGREPQCKRRGSYPVFGIDSLSYWFDAYLRTRANRVRISISWGSKLHKMA